MTRRQRACSKDPVLAGPRRAEQDGERGFAGAFVPPVRFADFDLPPSSHQYYYFLHFFRMVVNHVFGQIVAEMLFFFGIPSQITYIVLWSLKALSF